ncbi:hypothetical protein RB623_12560 [Mesorhizobium sp. LHD-90]|uniref:hypothetical protein n=1 Tax=Mesorhizobium sp. LHD-90 TaxID=3071414 RepID=UPI0027E09A20|nr:hypothetical protein [Mesorhizobium sp. LHD-90]MDQ6434881.1 hypothetical protein [Mesorhizobium sp. LHD-90]
MPARSLAVLVLLLATMMPAFAGGSVLFLDDRGLLARLEERGYGFGDLFGKKGAADLETLYREAPAYKSIVDTIGADVGALRAEMKEGGRQLFEVTDGNVGRIIDMRWLKTKAAAFRLVGVVNRVDRRDFLALKGSTGCGEARFVYRLAYAFRKNGKGKVLASRLPFNLNAVFDIAPDADGSCQGVAARWTPGLDETADIGWLVGGPLERDALTFRQLEVNAQVVRFPSGQETEFGGQAAYLMRIFAVKGDAASEVPLENTVDTARLLADAGLKAALADYVLQNVSAIDTGVYEIPERFLARKVVSYSTFGSARAVNHPFSGLFQPADFSRPDFSAGRLVRSPEALLDRLDNGACQGCHQSGSTAGFHVIGLDDASTSPLNSIEVGISPHLHAELPRRTAYLAAVASGAEPNRFRPLSAAPPADWSAGKPAYETAGAAMPCMMAEEAKNFGDSWSCGAGTVCTPLAGTSDGRFRLAQCLLPQSSPKMFSGHPCMAGEIATDQSRPFNDRMNITGQFAAFDKTISRTGYTCRPPKIGVPGGLAYRACDDRDRTFAAFRAGQPLPSEICGLAGGKKFDLCVATNNFDQCLGGAVVRGNRPTCSAEMFCREDYMCQQFPPDTPGVKKIKGVGFCSPTYFVFQMRIDNHTTPWDGAARAGYRSDEGE